MGRRLQGGRVKVWDHSVEMGTRMVRKNRLCNYLEGRANLDLLVKWR